MRQRRTLAALALAVTFPSACRTPAESEVIETGTPLVFTRVGMGVRFQVALFGGDPAGLQELAERCFTEVARLEGLLSNWSSSSAISRLNADPAAGRHAIDPELARVLGAALDFCAESEGAFDVTVGALLRALGFYDQRDVRTPSPAELDALLARTGCGLVSIDAHGHLLRSVEGIELDVSGVSKGWAVDRVVELLRAEGVTNACVTAGASTVYGLGSGPEGRGWPFEVPTSDGGVQTWHLRDEAVATSGSRAFVVTVEGNELSHVIDPSTGLPVRHGTRTTVFRAPSAALADMASTALLVMGAERGAAWLDAREDWARECAAVFAP